MSRSGSGAGSWGPRDRSSPHSRHPRPRARLPRGRGARLAARSEDVRERAERDRVLARGDRAGLERQVSAETLPGLEPAVRLTERQELALAIVRERTARESEPLLEVAAVGTEPALR